MMTASKIDKIKVTHQDAKQTITATFDKYLYLRRFHKTDAAEAIFEIYMKMLRANENQQFDKVVKYEGSVKSIFWINCFA